MALKFIQQDATTLREAYEERKAEYDTLRAGGRWSGAILRAGTLLELALKLVICKLLGVSNLPTIFQVHDLNMLLHFYPNTFEVRNEKFTFRRAARRGRRVGANS